MNNIKISLVFACYNVARYLDKLYDLIINQPYKNIEIIFIEDCSTDNTRSILKGFIDPRVKVIENTINMGAAVSRNTGIKYSTGDYIWFPDPDDLFDKNLIKEVADICSRFSPDVIVCGMREEYESSNGIIEYDKNILSKFSGIVKDNFNKVLVDLEESFLFGYTNNKFYKLSTVINNNIKNKPLALKEDFEFNIKFFSIINDFYILNKPYYFYKKRNNNSLTTKFVPNYWSIHKNSILIFKNLLELNGELTPSAKKLLINRFYRFLLSAIERNTNKQANLNFIEQKNWIKSVLISDTESMWFISNSHLVNGKLKFFSFLSKKKYYTTLVICGYIIKYIKRYLPILFAKIK